MQLLVGLGNPGPQHEKERHNVGFMAVERIARRHNFTGWMSRFQGALSEGRIAGEKVLCLKPQTYMNRSGQCVGEAMRFYKLDPSQVTVLHDELDLLPGRIRIKSGGSAGGHNGIKDIDRHIGTEYRRVRIGIGHPGDREQVTGYVLGNFSRAEEPLRDALLDAMADYSEMLVSGRDSEFMSKVALSLQAAGMKGTEDGI